jgi:ABC-type maltose transport system permease subunit
LELTAGVALLTNLWAPTALVLVAPVTVNVFVVDVFLNNHFRGRLMGSGALLMSVFLMLAYFNSYRPMLVRAARLDGAAEARPFAWFDPLSRPWRTALMIPLGLVSLAVGLVMIGWVFLMIGQHFTRH